MRVAFDPPPGLVSNQTTYAIPGAWADIENMRFVEGRAQTIGGWQEVFEAALTGVCRNIHSWTNRAGAQNIAFGTHLALHVHMGGIVADITPSGLAAGAVDASDAGSGYGTGTYSSRTYSLPSSLYNLRTWSLDTWGETLVAVPRDGTLYHWTNSISTPATAMANAPDQITAMLVTPERQVLALGCNEEVSNDFNPLCIRGCDIEDLNDWTSSASNNAFEHILEGGGHILAGRMVGPYVAVWTDNALHQGQFLGNPDQSYRFDRVDSNCGIIGANAACVLKGVAYWIGKDRQVRAWTPGARPSILPCPIGQDFITNLHAEQSAKIVAVSNSRFDEVWFFYPDQRDGNENSRYIAISTTTGAWFRGKMGRTSACDAGVLTYPVATAVDGKTYNHEIGTDAAGQDLDWRARSAAFYLEESERVVQLHSIRPDFKDQEQTIDLLVHARNLPQASSRTLGPVYLEPALRKKDFRITGAIVELEFRGRGFARFGRTAFDMTITGRR